MLRSCRSFALGVGLAALASVLLPQAAGGQPIGRFRTPQFTATAVGFKALHETHWNWLGSDEVFANFYDFGGVKLAVTSVFDDVDAGETRNIAAGQSCIAPQPACDRGVSSLAFGIVLMESDQPLPFIGGFCHGALGDPSAPPPTPEQFEASFDAVDGDCVGNDLIGKAKVKLSQTDLLAMLPQVGASVDTTVPVTGGAGRYEFTYRLTRLPDLLNLPPIVGQPVTLVPFTLSAAVASNPTRVVLTWTGASTSTVDIYRNSAILVTTANSGSYTDQPPSGTYKYRVCNLGSATDCSPVVSATVP